MHYFSKWINDHWNNPLLVQSSTQQNELVFFLKSILSLISTHLFPSGWGCCGTDKGTGEEDAGMSGGGPASNGPSSVTLFMPTLEELK